MTRPMEQSPEAGQSWSVSLAFWASLIVAAGLYGVVALSPKLMTYLGLKNEFYINQVRLVALEKEVGYLKKVADALENDPDFSEELARISFDATRPGDERITIDSALQHRGNIRKTSAVSANPGLPWYAPVLRIVAEHWKTRMVLLGAAALLTIAAFSVLHESHSRRLHAAAGSAMGCVRWFAQRYTKPRDDNPEV